jgi:hypothetical protein
VWEGVLECWIMGFGMKSVIAEQCKLLGTVSILLALG